MKEVIKSTNRVITGNANDGYQILDSNGNQITWRKDLELARQVAYDPDFYNPYLRYGFPPPTR